MKIFNTLKNHLCIILLFKFVHKFKNKSESFIDSREKTIAH